MDLLAETFFVAINLSSFELAIWSTLNFYTYKLREKLLIFFIYFLFNLVFVLAFTIQTDLNLYLAIKNFFFGEKWLILTGLFFLLSFIILKKQKNLVWLLVSPFLGWILFFLFFGREKFFFGKFTVQGLNLFQAQNPIIFFSFFYLIFFSKKTISISLLVTTIILQVLHYHYDKKNLESQLTTSHFYSRYSSPTWFTFGSFLLIEEERGVYEFIRKQKTPEPIYKFTMKPLRYLTVYERQSIQALIEEFEFPIVIKQEDKILVYELYKSYQETFFRVEVDRFELSGKVYGPKF